MKDDDLGERRQAVRDMAYSAHMKAMVNEANLLSHKEEDERILKNVTDAITSLQTEIKGINKWIWIATGLMMAVGKGFDILTRHP